MMVEPAYTGTGNSESIVEGWHSKKTEIFFIEKLYAGFNDFYKNRRVFTEPSALVMIRHTAGVLAKFMSSDYLFDPRGLEWMQEAEAELRRVPFSKEPRKAISFSTEFWSNVNAISQTENLRYLGDRCLFMSGMFPEYVKRAGFFENTVLLGSRSYQILDDQFPNGSVFSDMSDHFRAYARGITHTRDKFMQLKPKDDGKFKIVRLPRSKERTADL